MKRRQVAEMFCDKVNRLLENTGASSVAVARHAGCSPSNISRLRSGARVPSPDSPTINKFISGLYSFAEENNVINRLCAVTGGDPSGLPDEIRADVHRWLYDMPEQADMDQWTVKTEKAPEKNYFADRLDAVMNLVSMSNTSLGRAANLDPSYISRFRRGVRTPRSNPMLTGRICEILLREVRDQDRLAELAGVMNTNISYLGDPDSCKAVFYQWINDPEPRTAVDSLTDLLDGIDNFYPDMEVQVPPLEMIVGTDILDADDTSYFGIEGIRNAVLRFLGNAVRDRAESLWLFSDQDMEWMTGDADFFRKWQMLMVLCIRNRTRIRIIHNIERGSEEMISAITGWMPLYMSGMIESYACDRKSDPYFSNTRYLRPGHSSLFSSQVRCSRAEGWYEYIGDERKLLALEAEFQAMFSRCRPLVRVYTDSSDLIAAGHAGKENIPAGAMIESLINAPSVATMPVGLLERIIEENRLTDQQKKQFTAYRNLQAGRLEQVMDIGSVFELIALPSQTDLEENKAGIDPGPVFSDISITYTRETLSEHIDHLIRLLKENTSYNCVLLPEFPFAAMQIIHENDSLTVIKQKSPCAVFVMDHPHMLSAFERYFEMLKGRYALSRGQTVKQLERYAEDLRQPDRRKGNDSEKTL